MRLFVGLDLPGEIKEILFPLLKDLPAGKPSTPLQLHLTLFFIGEVPENRLKEILEALNAIQSQAMELNLIGVGCFPTPRRPRIIWAGLTAPNKLLELKTKVDRALENLGFPVEKRKFHPHITLARIKKPHPKGVTEYLARHSAFQSRPFLLREFQLYQSQLTPKGSVYTKIKIFPLT